MERVRTFSKSATIASEKEDPTDGARPQLIGDRFLFQLPSLLFDCIRSLYHSFSFPSFRGLFCCCLSVSILL